MFLLVAFHYFKCIKNNKLINKYFLLFYIKKRGLFIVGLKGDVDPPLKFI